jgi:DNA mismatch repair protein MutL
MPIKILPEEVASQIAAGEVVERPASVVKELLENALDAQAQQITILVEGAGRELVEVADNGIGIPADELPLAVSRHATSKLNEAADLFHIASLGFRGEALASIGSVSRLTIASQVQGATIGARIKVEGGAVQNAEPIGAPPGTTVRVTDLFYNVPARLKFLKTDRTERRRIDELVTRYAVAYSGVRIQLKQDGRLTVQTSGNGDQREVLAALFGAKVARQMLEVLVDYDDLKVRGFISPTSLTRANRREITFFVNGRWVHDTALTAALLQAYHTLLMVGRYPMGAIFLEMPPETVDVNVHPAKAEVRFRERDRVFSGVRNAIRRALLAYTPIPELQTDQTWPTSGPQRTSSQLWPGEGRGSQPLPFLPHTEPGPTRLPETSQPELPGSKVPLLRLVGQVGAAYLVAEGPDGIYLVDQHAAHERILFERFMALRETGIPSQTLLEPVSVELSPAEFSILSGELSALNELGFQVEEFGRGTFLVRAIPNLLAGMDPAAALRVIVEDFEEDETPLQSAVEAKIIGRVCKRAAVKAGHVLSEEEQRALLRDLEACESPRTCPHGRSTMIHLSVDLLARQFGRR